MVSRSRSESGAGGLAEPPTRPGRADVGLPRVGAIVRGPVARGDPVAEAAQQWLDAKDDGDQDLVSEAGEDLAYQRRREYRTASFRGQIPQRA